MGFSRQEYWSGLSISPPGDLPDPGIEPVFPISPILAGSFFTAESSGKSLMELILCNGFSILPPPAPTRSLCSLCLIPGLGGGLIQKSADTLQKEDTSYKVLLLDLSCHPPNTPKTWFFGLTQTETLSSGWGVGSHSFQRQCPHVLPRTFQEDSRVLQKLLKLLGSCWLQALLISLLFIPEEFLVAR